MTPPRRPCFCSPRVSVTTSAPMSDSIIEANGPGPRPANSTIATPARGTTELARCRHRALCHHLDQVGAVDRRSMDVAHQTIGGNLDTVERRSRPVSLQRGLDGVNPHHAVL